MISMLFGVGDPSNYMPLSLLKEIKKKLPCPVDRTELK